MRTKLAWIFTVALLAIANIAAEAQVKVIFGDDGKKEYSGKGGKITYSQTDPDNGKVTVTITASPNEGFTINKEDIHVYEVISPNMTRAGEPPVLGKRLDLDGPKGSRSEKTDYSVTIDAKLGLWIKKATFNNSRGSKAGTSDYSGTYYIASGGLGENLNKTNGKEYTYDPTNPSNNFYLCPTEGWCYYQATNDFTGTDNGMPFLTTYQCRNGVYDAIKAVWYVEKDPNSSYYYIRQAKTGKYLVANGVIRTTNSGQDRMRVHLEEIANLNEAGNKVLFSIDLYGNYLVISPKEIVDGDNYTDHNNHKNHKWLTVNNGNYNSLKGESGKTGGPTGYANTAGIICIFTQNDANAPFYLEKATVDPPIITNNYTAENTFTIKATEGDTIYYTTDGTTPTTSTTTTATSGTGITPVNVTQTEDMTVIKAIAKGTGDYSYFPSAVATYNIPRCEKPVIKVSGGNVTITCATEGAIIHYTTNGDHATSSSDEYTVPFAKGDATTIRAIAVKNGYINSNETSLQPPTEVSSSTQITDMSGNYLLTSDFTSSSSIGTSDNPFKGIINGNLNTLTLGYPLVAYADGATIKNVILNNVNISSSNDNDNGNAGAICCEATGDTRIYNCGVLSGSVGGGNNVGGIVGLLDGRARVINCYNYAEINSGSNCGGIVGYNNVASTSNYLQTMVMNCMNYGSVTGENAAPIYGGAIIHNKYSSADDTGLNNYCYFLYDEEKVPYVKTIAADKYNGALGAEERFLNRFEFFRMTLNSTRNLAAYYVTGDATKKEEIAKWVLDKSIAPYPILKAQAKYPSVVNPDAAHATAQTERNKGGLLGTLDVTISGVGGGAVFSAPSGATITNGSLQLNITDKDYDNFNYNYRKVQLPYYNEVGTGNYTKASDGTGRVVTGWKIKTITGGTPGSFTTNTYDSPSFNFVDRKCTNKDLYGTNGSNRVFAQGAYWEVPDGVTAIEIEPYWAKAVYLSDANYDMTYNISVSGSSATANKYGVTVCGSCPTTINGQTVYNDITTATNNLGSNASKTVYDYAVVLVGNYHQAANNAIVSIGKPLTFMSADLDSDNEPDNTLFYYHNQRKRVSEIRFDFLNIPGIGMVKRTHDATTAPEPGIFKPQGWFEITNTALIHCGQFEYAAGGSGLDKTILAPLILQGGVYEQFVSGMDAAAKNTNYILIGSNAWFKNFANGCHTKNAQITPKVPINVAGGDYTNFYLTGIYQPAATQNAENAECYIDGGRFSEVAGSGMQQVDGDVTWLINAADITSFFGGGINAAKPITGSISTTISNSYVDEFYGGPKFGDMSNEKTVTNNATDCHFGKFFGAGYGGTAYNRVGYVDDNNVNNTRNWNGYVDTYYKRAYSANDGGISTNYEYEFIPHSDGKQTVARFFVNYASLSLASTRDVTNTLSGCTIGTFYGGGSLGAVNGNINSTLTNCKVTGSTFGAGFSASVPTVEVWNKSAYLDPNPTYNRTANVYNNANVKTPKDNNQFVLYTWSKEYGTNADPFTDTEDGKHYIHTDVSLEGLGTVTGNITLTINGNTIIDENGKVMKVGKSVYGGGEESAVKGNTTVTVNGGTIGTDDSEDDYGNVFGGGKQGLVEKNTTVTISGGSVNQSVYGGGSEADVLGNTNVNMTDGYIFNGIFGGGLSGSVGTFTRSTEEAVVNIFGHTTHDGCIGKPTSCADGTGKCTIVVSGGQIGPIEVATLGMKRPVNEGGPVPEGWVWGAGRGLVEDPETHPDTHFTAYVNETDVTIEGNAFILESIIGGGEFGRVLGDTHVTIEGNCQIGVGEGQVDGGKPVRYADEKFINPATTTITNDNALPACSHYEYGHDYDEDGKKEYLTYDPYYDKYYDATSGSHKDNIPDGLKQGSTANACDGKTWIGCVFGGGSGYYPYEKDNGTGYGWVRSAGWVEGNTLVEIKGGHILTNVYGANEYTDVKGSSTVMMTGGTVGVPRTADQIKDNPLNGNIFGAGKGDPRTNFNEITNVGSTVVEVTGGIIYGSVYGGGEDGHVTGNAVTTIGKETTVNEVITKTGPVIGCVSTSDKNGNVFGGGMGAVSALTSGVVGGNVTLGIVGGKILGSVYGGGQIASVGTHFTDATHANYGKMQDGDKHGCLTINLTGGTIEQNVYGGCMGANADASKGVTEDFAAKLGISKDVAVNLNQGVADNAQGCAVKGSIFGCNNVNGSPEGTVEVHVYGTQHAGKSQIANTSGDSPVTDAKTKGSYDVSAVYGGGNLAAYIPSDGNLSTAKATVIIDGCDRTSIRTVYGGGNAASTPATSVTVNGTYEINELFGGGNGLDALPDGRPNPGANVGYKNYTIYEEKDGQTVAKDDPNYDTKAKRINSNIIYGTGAASVNIYGGNIHAVFGGSNTKGNVRISAITLLDDQESCHFNVDEAYGGGKSAPMDAEAQLHMSCIPGLKAAYGGAQDADILGDVTLNITNGNFDRVFGGNNISGTIGGTITVNIEETGCKPVIIGQLYGGGNLAPYTAPTGQHGPTVNVKSFTGIGEVYGGGYGDGAIVTGDTYVNINEVLGDKASVEQFMKTKVTTVTDPATQTTGDDKVSMNTGVTKTFKDGNGENANTISVEIPLHMSGKIGVINNVFGGGNAAKVIGNTNVNIGTLSTVDYVTKGSGEESPRTKILVVGVDIRGNVYGGGNNAEVTGNTNVTIGKYKE